MALIFRPRNPRRFSHKPIYWDPKKEDLDRRVEQIRQELVARGEISAVDPASGTTGDDDQDELSKGVFEEQLSESMLSGARHLKKQRDKGIDNSSRSSLILRNILILLLLGFIIWILYYRGGSTMHKFFGL